MRLEGDVLHVNTGPTWYLQERGGSKPNTVRIVDDFELDQCYAARRITITAVGFRVDAPTCFTRTITDVFDITDMLPQSDGRHVVVICWEATDA